MKNRVIVKKDNPINDHMISIVDFVNPEVKIVASMMTIIFGISSFFMIVLILLCLLCFFLVVGGRDANAPCHQLCYI